MIRFLFRTGDDEAVEQVFRALGAYRRDHDLYVHLQGSSPLALDLPIGTFHFSDFTPDDALCVVLDSERPSYIRVIKREGSPL